MAFGRMYLAQHMLFSRAKTPGTVCVCDIAWMTKHAGITIIYADAAPPPPQAPAGSPISICAGAAPERSHVGSLCAKCWCD